MPRRSTIKALPAPVRAAVDDALKRGCTIDAIKAVLDGLGQDVSRSAVGRYAKEYGALAAQQRDMQAVATAFGKEFGGEDDLQGRMMVQLLTSVITRAVMPMATGEELELDGKELHFLARAVKDATSASKIDIEREAKIREEAAKQAKRQAASDAVEAGRAAGASEAALDAIKKRLLGIAG